MRNADMQPNARGFRVPVAVTLRKCSVVIIGSTCRICGRDFKCESDVALHTRWRHNGAIGSLMDSHSEINLDEEISQKCDVCDMTFEIVADLRFHKRLIHGHVIKNRRKRRKEMVRIKFKLNGVTTTDVNLDRRYIELPNSLGYFVDVCETSDSLKNVRRQNDCAGNIDLSLPNHVVDKSHMQCGVRPHEAANRYIVGKFASTKGDASRTAEVGKSLVEISNMPYKDAIPVSDIMCQENKDRCYLDSQTATDVLVETFSDSVPDKENSGRINELERRNTYCQSEILLGDDDDTEVLLACQSKKDRCYLDSQTATDILIKTFSNSVPDKENSGRINELERRNTYCQSEILLGDDDDTEVLLACQSKTFDEPAPISKKNSLLSECPRYSIRWFDKVAGTKETTGLTNSLIDSMKMISNNENSYDHNAEATMRLSPSLSRLDEKTESTKANSNIDDDVQEVLRIIRGNTQSDINHESPNRMEREILQNAVSDTFTLPSQLEPSVCPEKYSVAFTNFESSDYSPFMTESDYQFLANSFDKKLGIYLEDLQHYGIKLYNDLPEINNNLEEYWVYAPPVHPRDIQQDFFET